VKKNKTKKQNRPVRTFTGRSGFPLLSRKKDKEDQIKKRRKRRQVRQPHEPKGPTQKRGRKPRVGGRGGTLAPELRKLGS